MTGILPQITSRAVLRALQKAGFYIHHQTGSHLVLRKDGKRVTVPMHNVDLKKGTLKSIMNQAGLSVEELKKLL